jgi:hypothetical protein
LTLTALLDLVEAGAASVSELTSIET